LDETPLPQLIDDMKLKITEFDGMVSIEEEDFSYSLIVGLYKNAHGEGLQINNENNREKILLLCRDISSAIIKFKTPNVELTSPPTTAGATEK